MSFHNSFRATTRLEPRFSHPIAPFSRPPPPPPRATPHPPHTNPLPFFSPQDTTLSRQQFWTEREISPTLRRRMFLFSSYPLPPRSHDPRFLCFYEKTRSFDPPFPRSPPSNFLYCFFLFFFFFFFFCFFFIFFLILFLPFSGHLPIGTNYRHSLLSFPPCLTVCQHRPLSFPFYFVHLANFVCSPPVAHCPLKILGPPTLRSFPLCFSQLHMQNITFRVSPFLLDHRIL